MTGTPDDVGRPPTHARWFVRIFLALFVACSIFGIELFPLTGFRLFSRLRTEHRIMWVADTVSPSGQETPLWFTDLPRAYQGFPLIMPHFEGLSPSWKAATCAAWLSEARRIRRQVVAIRFYRVSWRILPRAGDRPASPESRALKYACR
jgi:hypothetical protein